MSPGFLVVERLVEVHGPEQSRNLRLLASLDVLLEG